MGGSGVSQSAHGVVHFKADGKAWKLCMSVNALCRLEQVAHDWAEDVGVELGRLLQPGEIPPLTQTYRAAFWAGLQDHHPDLTDEDAGRLMHHVGLVKVGGLIGEAVVLAHSPPKVKAPRPRKASWLKKALG